MKNDAVQIVSRIASDIFDYTGSFHEIAGRGTCNRIFITDDKSEKMVIRLNSDRDNREFYKEHWCMVQAATVGVSVPRSLRYGFLEGWNYGVQSFEGDGNGADDGDQLLVWRWLGEAAAKFHKIPVKGFGDILKNEGDDLFEGNWQKYVEGNIRSVKDSRYGLSSGQATNLQDRFERLAETCFAFGLCHGDLTPRNVVLDGRRRTLIDWGCAHAHVVPHFDFRELLRDHARDSKEVEAFITGYGVTQDPEKLMPEIESLLLLCSFDLVRWARDRAPSKVSEKDKDFRDLLDRFQ